MYEKELDLIEAFRRGQMGRRTLIRRLGALGVTAATAGTLVNMAGSRAMAMDFDWKAHSGKSRAFIRRRAPQWPVHSASL